MVHPCRSARFFLFASVCAAIVINPLLSGAAECTGIVHAPSGVDLTQLTATVLASPPTGVENDPVSGKSVPVSPSGEFTVECTSPTVQTIVEIFGKGVRRARFPWPFNVLRTPHALPSFRLEPGGWAELKVVDAKTKSPLPDVLISSITPTENVAKDDLDKTYPFSVRGGAGSKALVTGLLPNQPYYALITAPGHIRRRVQIVPSTNSVITLEPGGLSLSGRVRGEKTGKLYPHEIVLLTGGPDRFSIRRRTDAQSRFSFGGLPGGTYHLVPFVGGSAMAAPTEYSVFGKESLEGIWLTVSEGITISGTVADLETGRPVEGADVVLRDRVVTTGADGAFQFNLVKGPWPVEPTVRHPDYIFSPDDQDADSYPVNGYNMNDILGLVLNVRKKRFLVVDRASDPNVAVSAILKAHGPLEDNTSRIERYRVAGPRAILPLRSSGTRVFVLRSSSGLVSDLTPAFTSLGATTTTIHLSIGPAARLEGSLTYEEGPPPPSFTVKVDTDLDGSLPRPVELAAASPDAKGKFAIAGLPPGTVTVHLLRPEGTPYIEEKLTLVRGETATFVRRIPRGLVLAGRTVDQGGHPLKTIPISVHGQDSAGNPLHLDVVSDEDGHFRIEGLGGAEVDELRAAFHGYAPTVLDHVPLPNGALDVVLVPRTGIRVEVDAPSSSLAASSVLVLLGRQRTIESSAPQWFYDVVSQTPLSGETSATVIPETDGRLRLAVEADGEWDVSPAFDWSSASPPRTVQLTPGNASSLTVRVQGIPEKDLDGLDVSLLNTVLPESKATVDFKPVSRSDGRLQFENLPAGEYLLMVTSPSGEDASRSNLDLPTGRSVDLTLDLTPKVTTVYGAAYLDGKERAPAAGAKVVLRYGDVPDPDPLMATTAAKDGSFRFDEVPSRRPLLLEAEYQGLTRQEPLPPNRATTPVNRIELVLEPKVSVLFTVPDSLRSRLASRQGVPILFQGVNGVGMVTLRPTDLDAPVSLTPGTYRVSLGEDPLGTMEIPKSDETVQRVLPEGEVSR